MQNKTFEPTDHLPQLVSSVMVVFHVLMVSPSGQGLCLLCIPEGVLLHSGKGLVKSVINDNISVLQKYHPQHGDIFLTRMSKIKLTSA